MNRSFADASRVKAAPARRARPLDLRRRTGEHTRGLHRRLPGARLAEELPQRSFAIHLADSSEGGVPFLIVPPTFMRGLHDERLECLLPICRGNACEGLVELLQAKGAIWLAQRGVESSRPPAPLRRGCCCPNVVGQIRSTASARARFRWRMRVRPAIRLWCWRQLTAAQRRRRGRVWKRHPFPCRARTPPLPP
jgi:hypothetical protein